MTGSAVGQPELDDVDPDSIIVVDGLDGPLHRSGSRRAR